MLDDFSHQSIYCIKSRGDVFPSEIKCRIESSINTCCLFSRCSGLSYLTEMALLEDIFEDKLELVQIIFFHEMTITNRDAHAWLQFSALAEERVLLAYFASCHREFITDTLERVSFLDGIFHPMCLEYHDIGADSCGSQKRRNSYDRILGNDDSFLRNDFSDLHCSLDSCFDILDADSRVKKLDRLPDDTGRCDLLKYAIRRRYDRSLHVRGGVFYRLYDSCFFRRL